MSSAFFSREVARASEKPAYGHAEPICVTGTEAQLLAECRAKDVQRERVSLSDCGRQRPDPLAPEALWKRYLESKVAPLLKGRVFGATPPPDQDADPNDLVYFIEANDGFIKIGHSIEVEVRLQALSSQYGDRLRLLLSLPGGRRREWELHAKFAGLRRHGEWFQPGPSLRDFIIENGGCAPQVGGRQSSSPNRRSYNLTARQEQVLRIIQESIERRGFPPTLREIGAAMGIRSTNGVNDHLCALERKGFIERPVDGAPSRAIKVLATLTSEERGAA